MRMIDRPPPPTTVELNVNKKMPDTKMMSRRSDSLPGPDRIVLITNQ